MLVVLDRIYDIERLMRVYIFELVSHIERYAVEYLAGGIVDQFQFYMFQLFADKFACSEVHYSASAEQRFGIPGAEWIEFLQCVNELRCNVGKLQIGIDVQLRFGCILVATYSSKRRVNSGMFSSLSDNPTA